MICGDLDLERAQRDARYRRTLYAFLVLRPHLQLSAIGFPELRRADFQLYSLPDAPPRDERHEQTAAG